MPSFAAIDEKAVTALRVLAVDEVEQARSGHPGLPLGAAPMVYTLFSRVLRHDPRDPEWANRDRFVLSAGHGSALLYAVVHVFGYDLPLAELKRFRQWGSITPGHPEHDLTPGVETTSGPLGQGFAAAVGMALAERHLAARFNRDGFPIVDHRTWVLASDGDLMEGISHEAASLAGHLRLGRLAVLYDDNHITIEGSTALACSDEVGARFAGYGWRVLHVEDGNDLEAILAALGEAVASEDRPTLIRVRTHIGFGSPHKHDSAEAHGAPLGKEEAALTRRALGWEIEEPFVVPGEVSAHATSLTLAGRRRHDEWNELLARYRQAHPELAAELERRLQGDLPAGFDAVLPDFAGATAMATREASGAALNALAPALPELLGGSADLAPSNNTMIKGEGAVAPGDFAGRNVHFGVREHAMAAIANGMALHGGVRPYVGTFLIFSDYMRPAVRMAALMHVPVIYVYTHDSVALGEDGPTHQPIEQLAALRAIPGLVVLRPADARETAACWRIALERRDGPTALALTRQKLPVLPAPPAGAVEHGAFIRREASSGVPEVVLLASGSEVSVALEVCEQLEARDVPTMVVSVPSLELLAAGSPAYRAATLGSSRALKVAIEMAHPQSWHRWVGEDGIIVGLDHFGASAPGEELARHFGFSAGAITERVWAALLGRRVTPINYAVPPILEGVVAGRHTRLESLHIPERISARDSALWGDRFIKDVARRLGWLDAPSRTASELNELERIVAALAADGASTLYLLGMGGSSLAPFVLRTVLGNPSGRDLVVVDTTDADRVGEILDAMVPARAAVMPVSKSGTTAETSSLTEIFWDCIRPVLRERTGGRFVALTEPGTQLAHLAKERGFLASIAHPVDVGGRFSALTSVGIFPALWLGHDVDALLSAGARALAPIGKGHPALTLASLIAAVATGHWARIAWCASPELRPLGAWAEQLIAESTGKEGKGVLPIVTDEVPPPENAWTRTLYLSPRFADEGTTALDQALDRLAVAGHCVARWRLRRAALGEAFAVLELATAMAALFLGVNPFDEPDVVRAKDRARAALSERHLTPPEVPEDPAGIVDRHIAGLAQDDAVALLAYLPESPAVAAALDRLRAAIGGRTGVPVTTAFGPRYLHSTGQLHKGGPDHIVPIVLTSEARRTLEVPGRRFTLAELRLSQALGDVAALADVGRRVLHLHLGDKPVELLDGMARTLAR